MPLQAELYALVAEDVARMVACFQPLGFASRHVDQPVVPAQAPCRMPATVATDKFYGIEHNT